MLDDLLIGARFLRDLPSFLRYPVTVDEARATLRRRLENREADFLALVKRAIYEHPPSSYRALLQLAGCEYGDLERLVWGEGLEGALGVLLRSGVYLTVDELKGRVPVKRGATQVAIEPFRLSNPLVAPDFTLRTGGSRGVGTLVPTALPFMREQAVAQALVRVAWGIAGRSTAIWIVPGGAAMLALLRYAAAGAPPDRWFSPVAADAAGLHPRYRWSVHALRLGALAARVPLPRLEVVGLDDPRPVARWLAAVGREGRGAYMRTTASAAVRLSLVARDLGLDLRHVQMTVTSEPLTATRLATIAGAGITAVPAYTTMETGGPLGHGCLAPEAPDDVHFFHDTYALVRADGDVPGLTPAGLLVSTLRMTAPLVLLNVSLGDRAQIVRRRCACPLDAAGWGLHLHTIRSDEKFTCAGMTVSDHDLVRVLDETLPAQFGGGPTDYQVVEEEDAAGRPVLRLLVHPRVGPLDAEVVCEAFLEAVGAGTGAEHIMSLAWRDSRLLRVERRSPMATGSGKILHLHVNSTRPDAGHHRHDAT